MRKEHENKIIAIFSLLLLVVWSGYLFADRVYTIDGMILHGLLIKEKKDSIIFFSDHGTLDIQRSKIKEIQFDREGFDIKDFNVPGRNTETGPANRYPTRITVSATPLGYYAIGKFSELFSWGYGFSLEADMEMKGFLYHKKKWYYPDSKAELGIVRFQRGSLSITGYMLEIGPVWSYKFFRKGRAFFSPQYGLGIYSIQNETNAAASAYKTSVSIIGGYIYPFRRRTSLKAHLRYKYITDSVVPVESIGLGISAAYQL